MLEVFLAVVVLSLRNRRIADAHLGPVGDLDGHHGHRARRRRVEREVHAPDRLKRKLVVFQQLGRAERRADDFGVRYGEHPRFVKRGSFGRQPGPLEHRVHDRPAEFHVVRGPLVQFRIANAVSDLDRSGPCGGGNGQNGQHCPRNHSHAASPAITGVTRRGRTV